MVSDGPPAGCPTIILIGRVGYDLAVARSLALALTPDATSTAIRIRIGAMLASSMRGFAGSTVADVTHKW